VHLSRQVRHNETLAKDGASRAPSSWALEGESHGEPVIGRLIALGLDDKLRGTAFAVVDLLSICRAKEAHHVTTYGSARWADAREVRQAGLLGLDGVSAAGISGTTVLCQRRPPSR